MSIPQASAASLMMITVTAFTATGAAKLLECDYDTALPHAAIVLSDFTASGGSSQNALQSGNVAASLRKQFSDLADRWELETGAFSLMSQKVSHRDFLKLVSLGPKTIPFILERLPLKPHNWFIALDALADETDRPNTTGTNPRAAVEKWLEWGRLHGWTANA